MKPSFALHITDTSIGLLHRTARGWLRVGETAFDTTDLAEALGYLRGSALGLSPGGLTTKLVLPNSQIKYLELDAPGPTDADRHNQVRAALFGQTPYNVEDLVFDWSGSGAKVQVAVVARETLDEAEAFATEHRFNPVSFVGMPPKGDFKGEPWFGTSKLAATLLEKGEKVDRDTDPVQIAARDLPKSHPGGAKAGAAQSDATDDAGPKEAPDAERPTRAQRRAAAAAEQARAAEAAAEAAALAAAQAEQAAAEMPAVAASAPDLGSPPDEAMVADAFPEHAAKTVQPPAEAPDADRTGPQAAPVQAQQPQPPATLSVTDASAFPEVAAQEAPFGGAAEMLDDLPPAPSAAIMAAFASRRGSDMPTSDLRGAVRGGGVAADARSMAPGSMGGGDMADRQAGKSVPPPLSRPKVGGDTPPNLAPPLASVLTPGLAEPATLARESAGARPGAGKPNTAFVTAPGIPGSRKRKSQPSPGTVTPAGTADARKSLTKPGGTFASSKQRGKPRYLGWILTGLLLVFLALIAAWSSFVVGSNDTAGQGTVIAATPATVAPATPATQTSDQTAAASQDQGAALPADQTAADEGGETAADVPAVDDEMLADNQDPAALQAQDGVLPDASPEASSDVAADATPTGPAATTDAATTDATNETAAIRPADVPAAPPPPPALEPAPVGVAVTDSPQAAPLNEAQDEIFLAATDAAPLALDPLVLPQPDAATDALPLPQLEPPPFGTVYQFDADGRIRPTPKGIITPEGVRLVAGKPSIVPPPRPDALIAAANPAAPSGGSTAGQTTSGAAPSAPAPFPSDPALAEARPRLRPAGLTPPAAQRADDGALLVTPNGTRISQLRPQPRPAAALAAGEAARQSTAAASLTAQAEQAAAIDAAVQASFQPDANSSPLAVSVSRKPEPRPKDMTRAVEAAVAAAVRAPEPQQEEAHVEPEADAEPETASAAPSIPTRASVAKQATYVNAINLAKINLIGVYGTKSSRYALIRQANGNYKKVKVGDAIDGGRVAAIDSDEVRYQKSGRMVSLKLPKI